MLICYHELHINKWSLIILVPPDVTNVTVDTITQTTAKVSWTKVTGNFDGYNTTISPNDKGETVEVPSVPKTPELLTTNLKGLQPGRSYTVSVFTVQSTRQGAKKETSFTTGKIVMNICLWFKGNIGYRAEHQLGHELHFKWYWVNYNDVVGNVQSWSGVKTGNTTVNFQCWP